MAVVRHALKEEESGRTLPCRVIFVFSTADQKVAAKNREKAVAKLRVGLEPAKRTLEDLRMHGLAASSQADGNGLWSLTEIAERMMKAGLAE